MAIKQFPTRNNILVKMNKRRRDNNRELRAPVLFQSLYGRHKNKIII